MINIKKRALSLLVAGNILLCHAGIVKAKADMTSQGDYITAQEAVNLRIGNDINETKIDLIKKGTTIRRILSCDNGWDLVEVNGVLGFVAREYFTDISNENIYADITFTEMHKMLETREDVVMHLGPSGNTNGILLVKGKTPVTVLSMTNNNWYLVNCNGTLGFIDGYYLEDCLNETHYLNKKVVMANKDINIREKPSLKSNVLNILYNGETIDYLGSYNSDWFIVDYYGCEAYISKSVATYKEISYLPDDFMKVIYLENDTELLSNASNNAYVIGRLDQHETAEVLLEEGSFYYVRTLEQEGYIKKSNTTIMRNLFISIDLSSQKLLLYDGNTLVLSTNIVSGRPGYETPIGKYKVQVKQKDRYLTGENYSAYVNYWIQFYGNYGLHDASWQNGKFGGSVYKSDGSHGCVRVHFVPLEKIYHLVKVGTSVIVHK